MKLATLLAQNARRYPDKVALVCGDRRLTFAGLDAHGDRLANALAGRGVGCGDRVAIAMPNGIELVEAMAAVLKLGALIVPLSTRLTAREIAYIVGHCEPGAVLYSDDMRPAVAAALDGLPETPRIVVGAPEAGEEGFSAFLDSGAAEPPPAPPAAADDCMIAYTSGTTGRPKGAVATNANLVIAALANVAEWELSERDVVLATTAMAHRTGLSRLANAIAVGCRLVMQPRFDAADALSLIEREKVTVAGGVPTVFRMMTPEFEKRPEAASSLRLIVATGEVFPVPVKERLRAAIPHVGLYTFLAQTEAGYIAALRPEEQEARPHATGRPIMGVEARAVDADGNDVPTGEPGELLVRCGAPGRAVVMREYFRDPEATAAAFEDGWFRTGDVGYFDDDGYPLLRRPRQGHDRDRRAQRLFQGGRDRPDRPRLGGRRGGGRGARRGVRRGGRGLRHPGGRRRGHRGRADRALPRADRELQEAEARPLLRRPAAHRHRQGDEAGVEEAARGTLVGVRGEDAPCMPITPRSRPPARR